MVQNPDIFNLHSWLTNKQIFTSEFFFYKHIFINDSIIEISELQQNTDKKNTEYTVTHGTF